METNPSAVPQPAEVSTPPPAITAAPRLLDALRRWRQLLLAGNPFYLISAALLLYGIAGVSDDARLVAAERRQLAFNFSSLEVYEALLVATAILLARRRIWYDAGLLLHLEMLFLLTPFILISQALFVGSTAAFAVCVGAAVLAIARMASLRRFLPDLHLSWAWIVAVGAILLANAALPLCFKLLHAPDNAILEHGYLDAGYALWWIALVPATAAIGLTLGLGRAPSMDGQRKFPWLAKAAWFSWCWVSGAHVFAIGWVYKLDWHWSYLAPGMWVIGWLAFQWRKDLGLASKPAAATALLALPVTATLLALASPWPGVAALLAGINVIAFAHLAFAQPEIRAIRHFLVFSLALLFPIAGAVPAGPIEPSADPFMIAGLGFVSYLAWVAVILPRPRWALPGSMAVGLLTGLFLRDHALAGHLGFQAGLVFLLAHSLRWPTVAGAASLGWRRLIAVAWILDSLATLTATNPEAIGALNGQAALLLAVGLAHRLAVRTWDAPAVQAPAAAVLMLSLLHDLSNETQLVPASLLLVLASFALFGVGTWLALSRHKHLAGPGRIEPATIPEKAPAS